MTDCTSVSSTVDPRANEIFHRGRNETRDRPAAGSGDPGRSFVRRHRHQPGAPVPPILPPINGYLFRRDALAAR
jgi:hypothetical protein